MDLRLIVRDNIRLWNWGVTQRVMANVYLLTLYTVYNNEIVVLSAYLPQTIQLLGSFIFRRLGLGCLLVISTVVSYRFLSTVGAIGSFQPLKLEIGRHITWDGTNNSAKGFDSIMPAVMYYDIMFYGTRSFAFFKCNIIPRLLW